MEINSDLVQQAYPIIERLARMRSVNGAFAYYERDDVYQEVWGMCLEALGRYDISVGPIENFLVRHVSNRLKNLKRDMYFRPGRNAATSGLARTRMNLVNALPLDNEDFADGARLMCFSSHAADPSEYVMRDETLSHIRCNLPEDLLVPFDELLENNKIRRSTMQDLREKIAEILVEIPFDV